jgi:hypothetical protein
MRIAYIVLMAAVWGIASCGKSGIGEFCDTDGDCAAGLSCILYGGKDIGSSGLECTNRKLCSVTCANDTDCASLGAGIICISDCHAGSCLKGSHSSSP